MWYFEDFWEARKPFSVAIFISVRLYMTKKPENKRNLTMSFGCHVTISVIKGGLETNEPMALGGRAAI